MIKRRIAGKQIDPVGLGCMGLSWGYGPALPEEEAVRLLYRALDLGYEHFDTAALYRSEGLLARALGENRSKLVIASKVGLTAKSGGRAIDCHPTTIKAECEESLKRLETDHIDLYYLHRLDRNVPIEDSMGAMAELVKEGKIGAVGLSEMSAATMHRAAAIHPIAAMQSEYSPFSRNVEIAVLDACRELGAAFVAFSPLARGVLAGGLRDPASLHAQDVRRYLPRFSETNWPANLQLADAFALLAQEAGVTPAQLSLSWVLSRGDHIHAIPGTTSLTHLEENRIIRDCSLVRDIDALVNRKTIQGERYPASVQPTIDTEEF